MCAPVPTPLTPAQRRTAESALPAARALARVVGRGSHDDRLSVAFFELTAAAQRFRPDARDEAGELISFEGYASYCVRKALAGGREANRNYGRAIPFSALAGGDDDRAFDPAGDVAGPLLDVREEVGELLAELPAVAAAVVGRRFGLADGVPLTVDEVAEELGLTRADVCRIERDAIEKMRGAA